MSVDFPYTYQVCGLQVYSDIILSELAEYKAISNSKSGFDSASDAISNFTSESKSDQNLNTGDIYIKSGDPTVPFCNDPVVEKPTSKFNKSEYFFEQPGVIRFLVREGSEIIYEILTEEINYALQSIYQNAIPIALLQRGIISFRASGVIDSDGHVWMFFAPPRSGKTATALFLMERGYQFFSDNFISFRLANEKILALPFGPTLHIWPPVLNKQSHFEIDQATPIREQILKYSYTVDTANFDTTERQVKGLVQVEHITMNLIQAPINMVSAFEVLRNAIYNNHLTAQLGIEPKIFQIISTIVKQTKLIQVGRPKLKESYHEIAEFIDKNIINGEKNG